MFALKCILLSSGVFGCVLHWFYGPVWHCPLPAPESQLQTRPAPTVSLGDGTCLFSAHAMARQCSPSAALLPELLYLSSAWLHLEHLACCDCLLNLCSRAAGGKPATTHLCMVPLLLGVWYRLCSPHAKAVTRSFTGLLLSTWQVLRLPGWKCRGGKLSPPPLRFSAYALNIKLTKDRFFIWGQYFNFCVHMEAFIEKQQRPRAAVRPGGLYGILTRVISCEDITRQGGRVQASRGGRLWEGEYMGT